MYLLYLKSSLPSGFAPFPQNQACLSSFSLMRIFIKDSSVHQITPSSPGVFIHSFIHSYARYCWGNNSLSAVSRFSDRDIQDEDAVSMQTTGTSSLYLCSQGKACEEKNGPKTDTKRKTSSSADKAKQEPGFRDRGLEVTGGRGNSRHKGYYVPTPEVR